MAQGMMAGDDDIRLLDRQEPDRRGYGCGTLPRAAPACNVFRLSSLLRGRAVALEHARVPLTCVTLQRNAPACMSRLLLLDMFYEMGIVR
jgi:hypothetical protein